MSIYSIYNISGIFYGYGAAIVAVRRLKSCISLQLEDGFDSRVVQMTSRSIGEGTNNTIKTLGHKVYGFRDTKCFFPKIMFERRLKKPSFLSRKVLF